MHKPESIEAGASFDLMALARELRLEEQYARGGHTARTLVRASDQRIVLTVMKAGASLREHHADGTASILLLSGRLSLGLPAGEVEVSSGGLVVLAAGLRHHVEAREDSALLLTLGWSSNA